MPKPNKPYEEWTDEEKMAYLKELEDAELKAKIEAKEKAIAEANKQKATAEKNKQDKVDPEDSDVAIGDAPMKQLEEDTLKELKEREAKK